MIRTNNDQINTRQYWNHIYTTPARKVDYWSDTNRFPKALEYIKNGDKFIDLGCGVGVLGRLVLEKRKKCEVWGIDISDEIIEENKKELPQVKWEQGYVGTLDRLPKDYFDVVFSGETVEHLDNPADLFKDAYRILKKGGRLVITTPQDKAIDSPEHMWYFSREDIENLFSSAGFKKVEFVDLPDLEHIIVFFATALK
jgi:ubiquinone/menaquinone biosynthesis C-methylase UbiE